MSNLQGAAEHNSARSNWACVQLKHAAVALNRVSQSVGGQSWGELSKTLLNQKCDIKNDSCTRILCVSAHYPKALQTSLFKTVLGTGTLPDFRRCELYKKHFRDSQTVYAFMRRSTWCSSSSGSRRSCHRTPRRSLGHQTQVSVAPGESPAGHPVECPCSGTGEEEDKKWKVEKNSKYWNEINKKMSDCPKVPSHLMNGHLLHPALLHRLLQRMAWNLHLDAVGANGLDVILILPSHEWKNLHQSQRETWEMRERCWQSRPQSQVSQRYQSIFVPRSLGAWDGDLADGFTDGLGLKLGTRCLSVPIFVPFSFQPVCLNFNISLNQKKKVHINKPSDLI